MYFVRKLGRLLSGIKYAEAAATKFSYSTIGAASDSWYDDMKERLRNKDFLQSAEGQKALRAYADMATKALTDPRTAGNIKGERLETLNRIREEAYNMDKEQWVNQEVNDPNSAFSNDTAAAEKAYTAQFGDFQRLERQVTF